MSDSAPDFVSDDSFVPDTHVQAASQVSSPAPVSAGTSGSSDFIPDDQFISDEDKHGTRLEQLKTAAEGVGEGLLGPGGPWLETHVLKVHPADIRGRAEANPGIKSVTDVGAFVGSSLYGVGEAGLLGEAAKGVELAAGLGKVGEGVSLAHKVGSAAVRGATEMALLQSGDEASKYIVNDPNAGAENAIANITLAGALGGAGGAFISGAVNPLWEATGGSEKLGSFLNGLKEHLNGEAKAILPENVEAAFKELGEEPHPFIRAVLSDNPKAQEIGQDLYRAENKKFNEQIERLPEEMSRKVADSLGVPLEDIAHFSNAEAGSSAREAFLKEVDEKYAPRAAEMEARDKEAAKIAIPDEERLNFANRVMEKALSPEGVGTNSPYYKIYSDYAQRILGEDTVRGMDRLKTELFNKNSLDFNEKTAWRDIRNMIGDFQESQIARQGRALGEEGIGLSAEALNQRATANKNYSEFRKMMGELTDHVGVGDFRGTGTLKDKIASKLSPEDFLRKFSPKGNVEAIEFLNKNFPETAKHIQEMESKKFIAPYVKTSAGELTIDYKGLNRAIEKAGKGSPEYLNYVMPPEALKKIESAKVINDALGNIKNVKNSGTPVGIHKVLKHVGSSALGAVGFLMGHNPVSGLILGETAAKLGKDAPEAAKLAYLKFLAADKPINAPAFKATVEMLDSALKSEKSVTKAVGNVFKAGTPVVMDAMYPSTQDIMKLDKLVAKNQDNPNQLQRNADGQVGHYMPEHQVALSQTVTQQVQYLAGLKPHPYQPGPLDKAIEPSKAEVIRYHRALEIAQNPNIVLQKVKDGTLQPSDIQDIHNLYPAMYKGMAQKLSNELQSSKAEGHPLPYKTKMGISLFLGQPLDASMQPQNILNAQPKPKQPPQPQGAPQKGSPSKLGKSNKTYQTPLQGAESDRNNRD